jgi:hypothetical protein
VFIVGSQVWLRFRDILLHHQFLTIVISKSGTEQHSPSSPLSSLARSIDWICSIGVRLHVLLGSVARGYSAWMEFDGISIDLEIPPLEFSAAGAPDDGLAPRPPLPLVSLDALEAEAADPTASRPHNLTLPIVAMPAPPSALAPDDGIYDYDACYDEMMQSQARAAEHQREAGPAPNVVAPKFIPRLLERAKERQKELEELRLERIEREIAQDRDQHPHTEQFITDSYQSHLNQLNHQSSHWHRPAEPSAPATDKPAAPANTITIQPLVLPTIDDAYIMAARARYFQRCRLAQPPTFSHRKRTTR